MTGKELQRIRHKLAGMDVVTFGRAIACEGKDASVEAAVRRIESMRRVPPRVAQLAKLFAAVPSAWRYVELAIPTE